MGYLIAAITGGFIAFTVTCITAASGRKDAEVRAYQEGYRNGVADSAGKSGGAL